MEAKELRIGNYVNDTRHKYEPFFEIEMFYGISDFKPKLEYEDLTISLHLCEPIPLTEQWLLDFGFKIASNGFYERNLLSTNCWFLSFNITTKGKVTLSTDRDEHYLTDIKHAHQLQNLYWCLCGEELTLKQNNEEIKRT